MKKARLHVTKWLRDIPVEAECTACQGMQFKASGLRHRPNREEYVESLQRQFEAHSKAVHADGA